MPRSLSRSLRKIRETPKIKIKKSIKVRKKDSAPKDTVRGSIPTPRDNGATFKVKIRRK